ncbi:MAG: hypothetical protein ACR2LN_07145 [Candidatus Levyibacteriota bacterium]
MGVIKYISIDNISFCDITNTWILILSASYVFGYHSQLEFQHSSFVVQHDIRMSANDPQIQMAEDLAVTLDHDGKATISGSIDIARSLSPFTTIYDSNGHIINSNTVLNGPKPTLSKGALSGHKDSDRLGENRVTWQPQSGVRLPTVIVAFK